MRSDFTAEAPRPVTRDTGSVPAWFLPVALAMALAAGGPLRAQALPPELRAFFQKYAAADDSALARLQAGQPVAKLLDTKERREVAALGLVRMDVPLDFFVAQFRDIARFKESATVKQIGKFGDPPRAEDLQRLTLEDGDLDALARCKAGDCALKASAEMMERFRRETGPGIPSKERANSVVRRMLAEYVENYAARGNAALISYADKKQAVHLGEEFLGLLAASAFLPEYAPQFVRYLAGYPRVPSPEVQSFLYWSKEVYGLKPVVSITHAMVYPTRRQGRPWCFIASKQIYANHYFEGSLATTVVVDGTTEPSQPRIWVMYLNRSRVDALRGWFVTLKRYILASRVRSGMEQNLRLVKSRLETRYRQQGD